MPERRWCSQEGCRAYPLVDAEWCWWHHPDRGEERREAQRRGRVHRRIEERCARPSCRKKLPPRRRQWCSDECAAWGLKQHRQQRRIAKSVDVVPTSSNTVRRPPDDFVQFRRANPTLPKKDAAVMFETEPAVVSRWDRWIELNDAMVAVHGEWAPPPRSFPERWTDLRPEHVDAMVDDFIWFRGEFFRTEDEEQFVFAPFHLRWLRALMATFAGRGKTMILSPPRHGKTELLSHLATWLICRFPNVRIVWVGPSEDVAGIVGAAVKEQLELNEPLKLAFCGPGGRFEPDRRSGRSWTALEFTVATRTVYGIKSPTFKCIGRGGTLVSRDTDVIICDDIEQDKSVAQPNTREKTRNWAVTSLFSRRTSRQAIVFIGSRQHPDDLWNHFLDAPGFETIVESAHDETCDIPWDDPERWGEHVGCMLWPEVHGFEWLVEMRELADRTAGRAVFEMVYLNRPHAEGVTMFSPEAVARAVDPSRVVGHVPPGARLIAGLDPAATGFQAAFLWAVTVEPFRLYMVDLDNTLGGGLGEARRIIREWRERYGLAHWVVEQTMWAAGLDLDHELKGWAAENGVVIEGHQTYSNKWDSWMGVTAMVPLFSAEPCQVSLPYGDAQSQLKTDAFRKQLIYFSSNSTAARTSRSSSQKSDIVMASWFPWDAIRRLRAQVVADAGVDYEQSYTDFGVSSWERAPWMAVALAG